MYEFKEGKDVRIIISKGNFDPSQYACIEARRISKKTGEIIKYEEPSIGVMKRVSKWLEQNWDFPASDLKWIQIDDFAFFTIINNFDELFTKNKIFVNYDTLIMYGYDDQYLMKAVKSLNSIFMAAQVPFVTHLYADKDVGIEIYRYGEKFNNDEYYYSHLVKLTEFSSEFKHRAKKLFEGLVKSFEEKRKNEIDRERIEYKERKEREEEYNKKLMESPEYIKNKEMKDLIEESRLRKIDEYRKSID